MKRLFLLVVLFIVSLSVNSQETMIIRADDDNSQDATLFDLSVQTLTKWGATRDRNMGNTDKLYLLQWTWGGYDGSQSFLLQFDLDDIPKDAELLSVKLTLSGVPVDDYKLSDSKSNEFLIQRVVKPWKEDKVTWNTRPKVTTENQIFVNDGADLTDINITFLINDMLKSKNYGLMISIPYRDHYRGLVFGSSENADPTLRPYLTVKYRMPGDSDDIPVVNDDCEKNLSIMITDNNSEIIKQQDNISYADAFKLIDQLLNGEYFVKIVDDKNNETSFKIIKD